MEFSEKVQSGSGYVLSGRRKVSFTGKSTDFSNTWNLTNFLYQAWNSPYIVTLQHQQAYLNSYARISLFLHFPMHFYISCFKAINAWFIYHSRSDISLCCQQCITSSSNVQFHSMLRVIFLDTDNEAKVKNSMKGHSPGLQSLTSWDAVALRRTSLLDLEGHKTAKHCKFKYINSF